jgi:hypothetical protein
MAVNVKPIAAPRIGSGIALFLIGGLLLALAAFALLAGAGGSEGASAVGGTFVVVGSAVIAVAFWVNLFGKIEARLIDIQTELAASRATGEAVEAPVAGVAKPATLAPVETDGQLMARYGISQVGTQYVYRGYKYDRLHDAVSYAARGGK